jgi:hypothetical protein
MDVRVCQAVIKARYIDTAPPVATSGCTSRR